MQTIHAVFENGVFRPLDDVNLPEQCNVEMDVRELRASNEHPQVDDVYAILQKRFNSGESDVAARHNEHQP